MRNLVCNLTLLFVFSLPVWGKAILLMVSKKALCNIWPQRGLWPRSRTTRSPPGSEFDGQ